MLSDTIFPLLNAKAFIFLSRCAYLTFIGDRHLLEIFVYSQLTVSTATNLTNIIIIYLQFCVVQISSFMGTPLTNPSWIYINLPCSCFLCHVFGHLHGFVTV